jgi:hypothetical protein
MRTTCDRIVMDPVDDLSAPWHRYNTATREYSVHVTNGL